MTTPYPVPVATEEPLGSVTRVLALSEAAGDGDGDGRPVLEDVFTGTSLPPRMKYACTECGRRSLRRPSSSIRVAAPASSPCATTWPP